MLKLLNGVWLLLLAFSCSSDLGVKGKTEAEVLFKEAEKLVEKERYISATERLNTIRSQHPYSYYATPAELLLADIKFLQEQFVEASASYQAFRDLHPKHNRMDYIVFKIAESFYKQIPSTFDRDLTPAKQAIKYYKELLEKYPNSQYIKSARDHIHESDGMLKEKEKYIADFYFRTESYSAARYRYLDIINNFEDKTLLSHSRKQVVKASFYMGEYKKCLSYLKKYAKTLSEQDAGEMEEWASKCGEAEKEKLTDKQESPKEVKEVLETKNETWTKDVD
ncbi:MAG: outer membrane protein assembly factor BamD [Halobacteriovoraceae bacterium]|nr:outer membrane protein assembly factor BamD [Halobacteriovoraceae bacterium]